MFSKYIDLLTLYFKPSPSGPDSSDMQSSSSASTSSSPSFPSPSGPPFFLLPLCTARSKVFFCRSGMPSSRACASILSSAVIASSPVDKMGFDSAHQAHTFFSLAQGTQRVWYAALTVFWRQPLQFAGFVRGLYFLYFFFHSIFAWHVRHNPVLGDARIAAVFLDLGLCLKEKLFWWAGGRDRSPPFLVLIPPPLSLLAGEVRSERHPSHLNLVDIFQFVVQ